MCVNTARGEAGFAGVDGWHAQVVGTLCKLCQGAHPELRAAGTSQLQRTVVAAEKLTVGAATLSRALNAHLIPTVRYMAQELARDSKQAMPQADHTVRDLVRACSKMVLLYHAALASQPGWGQQWRGLMDVMVLVMQGAQVS